MTITTITKFARLTLSRIKGHSVAAIKSQFNCPFVGSASFSSYSTTKGQKIPFKCDVCIIGGGAMGSSSAFWLKRHPAGKNLNVVVIERDPQYTTASTVLSLGGIRQQFSNAENVQLSLFGVDFINNIQDYLGVEGENPVNVNYTERGYLILATNSESSKNLHENHLVQKQFISKVELLSKEQIRRRFPWVNVDDVILGSFGTHEGWFDPWSLLNGFKKKALSLGVQYITGEVVGFDTKENDGVEESDGPKQLQVRDKNGQVNNIEFAHCVLATGYNTGCVSKLAGIGTGRGLLSTPIPVEPRKRYVYFIHAPALEDVSKRMSYVIDPSGVYVRPEGSPGNFYVGRCPEFEEDEPSCENLDVDYSFFDSDVWPHLAKRMTAFENTKIKSAWGGYYDYNTFDQNGIIGTHPCYKNLHIITGFSGHGIQQSPAAGRAVMELILEGGFKTIDLTRFGFERVIQQTKVLEKNIF